MASKTCPTPPPPPPPCPQSCIPPPPMAPCRTKPIMKGLHWAQTQSTLTKSLILSGIAGAMTWYFLGQTRRKAYADFYAKADLEDWADDMARKGLFDAVPKEGLKDNQHADK